MHSPMSQCASAQNPQFDYDEEADVVYISFERPQQASDSELLENNVLVRKRGDKIVGLTIMNASRFRA